MTHLSDTFKYISYFRHAGHQVGRKVGDMLEVLTYASIATDDDMASRLVVEPKLFGFSGAGHQVEFILTNARRMDEKNKPLVTNGGKIENPSNVISFIECKKVGVEQTINRKFREHFKKVSGKKAYEIPFDHEFTIVFSPRGGQKQKHTYSIIFKQDSIIKITKIESNEVLIQDKIGDNHRFIFTLNNDLESEVIPNDKSLRDYDSTLKNCRILEVLSVEENGVHALLNECLKGPQTPEKAKQSSFVALDVRKKKRFNSFDKRDNESEMVSVLVMTEFSHWEERSLNIVTSCIDRNFIVEDSLIIEAFEQFEKKFGTSFYDKITKENYEKDPDVKTIANSIVNKYQGKIFLDIEDGKYKKFTVSEGKFLTIS
jgi:hypothetical protein